MEDRQAIVELCENIASIYKEQCSYIEKLRQSKTFRIAYLLTRLKKEFINGDMASRKRFIRWMMRKDNGPIISDLHYVMKLEMAIKELGQEFQQAYPEFEEINRISKDELQDRIVHRRINKLRQMLDDYAGVKVVVFPAVVDWNIPLFQRPQQMAMAYAQEGVLCVYVTPNYLDCITDVRKIRDCCYLVTKENMMDVLTLAKEYGKEIVLQVSSTDNLHSLDDVNVWKQYCNAVLYEYIDEISDEITGKVPQQTIDRHKVLLKDESVYVVATADKLYDEVISVRGSNKRCLNSGNGVDCKHFAVEKDINHVPASIRPIIEKNKPIIGYFGAIANWFDFELIAYAAKMRPEYEFVMVGPHYGSHDLSELNALKKIENLHFVGTVEYKILPYVASHFTVATIPFKINEITESTSPIKLFEYMAMGKPCVTTAMRECFKYPIVKVAENKEEYVHFLDQAVKDSEDNNCVAELKSVAEKNSWKEKAREIFCLLAKNGIS